MMDQETRNNTENLRDEIRDSFVLMYYEYSTLYFDLKKVYKTVLYTSFVLGFIFTVLSTFGVIHYDLRKAFTVCAWLYVPMFVEAFVFKIPNGILAKRKCKKLSKKYGAPMNSVLDMAAYEPSCILSYNMAHGFTMRHYIISNNYWGWLSVVLVIVIFSIITTEWVTLIFCGVMIVLFVYALFWSYFEKCRYFYKVKYFDTNDGAST